MTAAPRSPAADPEARKASGPSVAPAAVEHAPAERGGSQDTRLRLLDAAAALFAEHGYAATSVGMICARAGVARTALYWHFGNKEGLLAAVLEELGDRWIETIRASVYEADDPFERLDRLVEGWRRVVEEQGPLLRVPLVAAIEQAARSDRVRTALVRVAERARAAIARGIEDSLGVPMPGAGALAQTMLTLLQGAAVRRLLDPSGRALDALFDEFRRTVLALLLDRLPEEHRVRLLARDTPAGARVAASSKRRSRRRA